MIDVVRQRRHMQWMVCDHALVNIGAYSITIFAGGSLCDKLWAV